MILKKFILPALGGAIVVLASCATQTPIDPNLSKTDPEYVNPYPVGTYEHFTAEKDYPKTYDVWRNVQLLPTTDATNSWINIDLKKQRGKLMSGDVVVMDYPISSGTRSRPTPPGDYKILEKIVDKRSNLYGKILDAEGNVVNSDADSKTDEVPEGGRFLGAPMKYWMRLTNDGVGHHIGNVTSLSRLPCLHPRA